ncbi:MAG TPA: chemotaxis protein CheW [Myxococcota bacterium]|nr:chemotaxis protein CheW [Myxococcota bacterium]
MANDGQPSERVLICRSHDTRIALPVEHVLVTMRPLPIEPFPAAPPFVLGLALVQGEPIPVVDAARLIGGGPSEATRFVILRAGARKVALAVDAVIGVRAVSRAVLHTLPPLLSGLDEGVVSAIGRLDAELLLVLRSAQIVSDSVESSA